MSKDSRSPLVDIAMSYVTEVTDNLKSETLDRVRHLFDSYISNSKSYNETSMKLFQLINTVEPLEKISSILKLGDIPAPPAPMFDELNDMNGASRSRKKTRSWGAEEDKRLIMGVHLYGLENWTLVAQFVGNGRTRSMCSQRWIRVLDPKISKNHWTEEEDNKLLSMVKLYGEKSWMKIATKLGNRSDVQCRYHFQQLQRGITSPQTPVKNNTSSSNASKSSSPASIKPVVAPLAPVVPITNGFSANNAFLPQNNGINNKMVTPVVSSNNMFPLPTSAPQPVVENKPPVNQEEKQNELPPLTEHELQLRLDEPFGFDDFDFFKSDPMYDNSFWTCMSF